MARYLFAISGMVLTSLLQAPCQAQQAPATATTAPKEETAPIDIATCDLLQKRAVGVGLSDASSKKKLDDCMFQYSPLLVKPGHFLAHVPPELDRQYNRMLEEKGPGEQRGVVNG